MAFLLRKKTSVSNKGELEKELEYQKRLAYIINEIHSAPNTEEILINLQGEILSLFDADRITIYAVDGLNREIYSKIKTGDEISEIRVPVNTNSIAGYCAWSGKTINIKDVYEEKELKKISPHLKFDKKWDERTKYRTKQVLVTPIIYKRHILGVVQLINKKGADSFSEEDEKFVQDIGGVLGVAFFKNQKAAQKTTRTKFDYLIRNNIITPQDLASAMSLARKLKKSVESVLMSDFNVSKEDIGKSLSEFYNTKFISYDPHMPIPTDLLQGLKPGFLKYNGFVPIAKEGDKIIVAMEDPNFLPARDVITKILPGNKFEYWVSTKDDIEKIIDLFFNVKKITPLTDTTSIEALITKLESEEKAEEEEEEEGYISEEDSAIVQLVNKIIIDAYNRGASDIHIEPQPGKKPVLIRIRVDGVCQVYQTVPYIYKNALISRIKIMADLDISERRLPQDGKIQFKKFAPLDIELRVATLPTVGQNEDVVMRILHSGEPIPLEKLYMSERDYKEFLDIIHKPYGIVLVVGPTGSGKTTTLHSALRQINTPEKKIWTAEDPVEITQEGLRQVQVMPKIGLDFAAAMRAFLRADPDVIMIGEMRDLETASTAIEASLTGHLVFSTLHTNSAPETITRLLDMGLDPFNFADAILGILAQRLARTLCPDCKEKYHPEREEFEILRESYGEGFEELGVEYSEDLFLYRAKGCAKCNNTGYRGRVALFELLVGTPEIKRLIQKRAPVEELRDQAIKDGMRTLMQDGIRKILMGLTDLRQVRSVCMR
jgi:type II secretory ATPase GspE/PulE/Tfp pilus assembly ATPase PilB-like protein